MNRRRSCLVVLVVVLVAVAGAPFTAGAQTPTRSIASLTLVSQTPWVAIGGDLVMRLRPPRALSASELRELDLSVTVHPSVGTRSAFQRSLTDRPTTSPLAVIASPVASLAADPSGAVEVRVGVQDPGAARDATRVLLRNGGVYPVVVELRPPGGGAVKAQLITHLLFVPAPPDGPRLGVTMILPIARPPALRPDGSVRFGDNAASSFTGLANAVSAVTSGLVFDPNPETLAALARSPSEADREALGALRNATAGRPVVGGQPFVPVARAAYTGASGLEALRTLLDRGRAVTEAALDSPADARVAVLSEGIDEAHLPGIGTDARVVVPERLLTPVDQRVTLANAIALRRGPARSAPALPAVVADAALGAHFGADRPSVLGAHQLLADLATIYFDNPGRRRAVVVMPPRSAILRAAQIAPFLAGLAASEVLTPIDLDEQFVGANASGAASSAKPPLRALAPVGPIGVIAGLNAVRADIASLSSTFPDDIARVTSFSDRALIAQSSDLRGRSRADYVRELADAIDEERALFRLPRRAAARLTARTGRIPITVSSQAAYPARVLLEVASDKLQFPGGATRTLVLTRRNTTTQIGVASQGSGTFPLRVVLKSPDGKLVLAESRFTVQSTAVSGVGVVLSIAALLVLAGWWIRHNRVYQPRSRRRAAAVARGRSADDA